MTVKLLLSAILSKLYFLDKPGTHFFYFTV